jgi:DNA (cytosine-5)-methyltransferase 1
MKRELIIDSFAGGGGASLGIAWATGHAPDLAINHDASALAMHAANHPSTKHVCEDVWHANLRELTGGRRVTLLWASPDCKHFSRAKGSVPVSKHIRSLAWVAVRWASQVRPKMIVLENVREFADWGPLVPRWECLCGWKGTEGQATLVRTRRRCPRCESLKIKPTLELVPDPGKRGMTFRLFVNRLRGFGYDVAWRNLNAADFGAPTHRRRLFLVARRDRCAIAWPEPTHGDPKKLDDAPLFAKLKPWRTAAECIDWSLACPSIFDRKRPLAEKTLRRIAMGLKRYVLEASEPFIVPITHHGDRRCHGIDEPLPTVTSAHRGEHALIAPTLIQTGFGERDGQSPRALDLHSPLGTVVAGGQKHALVSAWLTKHFGGMVGVPIDSPLPTTTMRGTQNQLTAAFLARFNHGDKQWNEVSEPLGTVTSQGNKFGLVYAFLTKYYGADHTIGQQLREPLHTVTSKHRFGLVYVAVGPGEAEPAVAIDVPGVGPCVISDIGMRMLTPRELARAQGFPDTYELTGTKTSQVAKIGNSVCPQVVEAIVKANCAAGVPA